MSERSDHADRLAAHTSDGGGCLETTQAAADIRNQQQEYTRRSLLTTIAGLRTILAAPDTDHTEPILTAQSTRTTSNRSPSSGKLRTLWMDHAIDQNNVQLAGQAISNDGYSFYREDVAVLYTRGPAVDDPYFSVYFHGEHDADPDDTSASSSGHKTRRSTPPASGLPTSTTRATAKATTTKSVSIT